MMFIKLLMLLAPGLISLRIYWRSRTINKADYKYLVCDYIIFSFLIILFNYAFMFFSYAERIISFSTQRIVLDYANSTIHTASFVFKYSFISLLLALAIPLVLIKLKKGKFK